MALFPNLTAGGVVNKLRLVKMDATAHRGVAADANAECVGVAGSLTRAHDETTIHANSGEPISLQDMTAAVEVMAGAAFSVGDRLKSDANGKAIAIATSGTVNQEFFGTALKASAALDEVIWCIWKPGVIRPALV